MPFEGTARFVNSVLDPDAPTCSVPAFIRDVRARLEASRHGLIAVDEHDVVLGRLGHDALDADDDTRVEHLMREGPTTIRPNAELDDIVDRMRRRDIPSMIVTRADGTLLGLLERDRAEEAVEGV